MKRLINILGLISVFWACPGVDEPGETGPTVRVHYYRVDGSYSGWGLHLWNDNGSDPAVASNVATSWASPRLFSKTSAFGRYVDVPVIDITKGLNFIVHKGEEKDIAADRTFPTEGSKEFWLISGVPTVFTSEPSSIALRAEFVSETVIEVDFKDLPGDDDVVVLEDLAGDEITEAVLTTTGTTLVYTLAGGYDFTETYFINANGLKTQITYSDDVLNLPALIYTGDDLGLTYSAGAGNSATIKVWSPVASQMDLLLYDKDDQYSLVETFPMTKGASGVWSVTLNPGGIDGVTNLDGYFYQLEVTALGETKRALDPYARSMAAFFGGNQSLRPENQQDYIGKAAIVDMESLSAGAVPVRAAGAGGVAPYLSSNTDLILYEVHIRDYTIENAKVDADKRGTFLGFAQDVAHLAELGITHAQFLPLQNHYRVDETNRTYQEAVSSPNYNWGYDPHSFFTLEGQYSTDAADPYARIKEFRALVDALHAENIGVIMDVVYNHTYSMSVFDNVAPGLYHRAPGGAAPVGDPAVASERPMVRKLIIDSLKSMVNDYGVDGFRFDLMGFMDVDTFEEIRTELGDEILLHGEGWNFTDLRPANAGSDYDGLVKGHSAYPHHLDVAVFNDTIRDSVKGSGENGHQADLGFVQGAGDVYAVLAGIVAGVRGYNDASGVINTSDSYRFFTEQPSEAIQYLGVHDGFTFWDKINFTVNGTVAQRAERYNQASAILFTSQGKILIQAGAEFGRAKPLDTNDPEPGRAANTPAVNSDPDITPKQSPWRLHNNSYSSSDFTNKIRWNRKTDDDFSDIYAYYQGLIAMRRAIPAFRYSSAINMNAGLSFILDSTAPGGAKAGHTDFTFMEGAGTLTLNFTNGPANSTYYLVGEVFSGNQNPAANPFVLNFNGSGNASVVLDSSDYADFDLEVWDDPGNLNIKLVSSPGTWTNPPGAYSGMGNNSIKPENVEVGNSIAIDLSIQDHTPGGAVLNDSRLIAFELDNTVESAGSTTAYTDLIVIHNTASGARTVTSSLMTDPLDWTLILSNTAVDHVSGVTEPTGFAMDGVTNSITVPARTSVVLAK